MLADSLGLRFTNLLQFVAITTLSAVNTFERPTAAIDAESVKNGTSRRFRVNLHLSPNRGIDHDDSCS